MKKQHPMFMILGNYLLPQRDGGITCYCWGGDTGLAMNRPDRSRLYIGILKQLKNEVPKTIDEIYGAIPETHLRSYAVFRKNDMLIRTGVRKRWSSSSILTCLVNGGYVKRLPKWKYTLTEKGYAYIHSFEQAVKDMEEANG